MKRIKRKPERFETLDIYRSLSRQEGYNLQSRESDDKFIDRLSLEFKAAKNSSSTIYGLHAQSMFEQVITSLERTSVVKSEDSGEIYSKNLGIRAPDFRLVLDNGQELFVEVKNFYSADPLKPFDLPKNILEELREYAKLFKKELKVAIYWASWNIWTLIPEALFKLDGDRCVIALTDAMMYNEMFLLGDQMIGTVPPLIFKIITDSQASRTIMEDESVKFTIGGVELYSGKKVIQDKLEQKIAFALMLYGDWLSDDPIAEINNNNLISISFVAQPPESTPNQGFEMIGRLSGMISRQFINLSAPQGNIESLSAKTDSSFLGILIPQDYKGRQLPIWRFTQQPKQDKQNRNNDNC